MVSRTRATTSSLSLRRGCCSAYSSRHEEYQTAGRIGRRGMGLRTWLLVSSSARLTLGDCVLTVDNVSRSPMVAAILYLTLYKIAFLLRRPLTTAYIATCPLVSVPRCHARSFLSPASPASVRRTSTTRLAVLSELSTGLSDVHLGHLALKEVVSVVRLRQLPNCGGFRPSFRRMRT